MYKRNRKGSHYRKLVSLKKLVLISQDPYNIERFFWQEKGGWLLDEDSHIESTILLDSIDISLAMAEIDRKAGFSEAEWKATNET